MAPEQAAIISINSNPHIEEKFEGLTSEEEYDALLYSMCQERGFTEEEIIEIREVNEYATETMNGHFRKDNITPTSIHLKRTAIIAAATGGDVFTVKLMFLHDLIEDTKEFADLGIPTPAVTVEDITARYGERMAKAVDAMSKVKTTYLFGKGNGKKETIERTILTLTHYKLFESLDDYRVVHAKLCDRYDYFLTPTPEITSVSVKRKAIETLELYVPLADLLQLRFLREELTYASLRALARTKVEQIEKNNANMFPEGSFESIGDDVKRTLAMQKYKHTPGVFVFQPSWYTAYRDYGSDLSEVNENSVIAPVVTIVFPFESVSVSKEDKRNWMEKMKLWFTVVKRAYGFPQGSWKKFKAAYMEGGMFEIPTEVYGKPVIMRFASYEELNRALSPVVNPERQTPQLSRAHDEFKRLHENFNQLKSVWPSHVIRENTHVGAVVKELIENLQRPLVRVYGKDNKPAIFPRGATLFDAACFFGYKVVQHATEIVVTRDGRRQKLSLSKALKEGDGISIAESDGVNNFLPKYMLHVHTHQARKMLQEGLKARIKLESGKPQAQRMITNQMINIGIRVTNALYIERQYAQKRPSRKISKKDLLRYFEEPGITDLLREISFPSFESFMIAMTLNRLTSKKKQRVVGQIIDRLDALRRGSK